ncbi:Scr1 family TA system antitoxin-like transcriptional regulator [Saccharopolyspora gloriosae]|uniref:Scr1 family TA system antitoxin-like transcriptional regulator n=1 Tax=Saccharopolyspora gloriosae TaxID=455344 RepID=UPI001FB5C59D|nr:Scr1 family TA system antitoxin-like transcriptional regulator [Saccharopolyspora gloriosae]
MISTWSGAVTPNPTAPSTIAAHGTCTAVELGHRDVLHVDGGELPGSAARRDGYRAAMRVLGLAGHVKVLPGDYADSGARAGRALLERGHRPTAVVVDNDQCANGLLQPLIRAWIRAPDDLSVVGYDNSTTARPSYMDLTTVRQDAAEMAELAKIARQRQPRRMYSDAMPGAFRRLSDHEQDATEILYFDGELIPGLLQTEDYARAVVDFGRPAAFRDNEDDVEARVKFRMERKDLLLQDNAPRIWFVIGEAAIRRPVGGTDVLRTQLIHLAEVIDQQSHVVMQVAPLAATGHPLLGCNLEVIRFGGVAADIAHQPTFIGGGVYLVDQPDVEMCSHAFDKLRAVALGPDESRALITKHAEDLGT